jgi:hypothetical protein
MRFVRHSILAVTVATLLAGCAAKQNGKGQTPSGDADPLDVLPASSAGIISVDVGRLVTSKAWQKLSPILFKSELGTVVNMAQEVCGIDLIHDVHMVVANIPTTDDDDVIILVRGNFDEPKISTCVSKLAEKETGKPVAAKQDGKLTVYSTGEETIYVGWADAHTLVINPRAAEGDPSGLLAALSGQAAVKGNGEVMALLGKVDRSAAIWGAFANPSSGPMQLTGDEAPRAIWGHLNHTSDLSGLMSMQMQSDVKAKEIADQVNEQLGQAAAAMPALVAGFTISAKGDTVVVTLAYDPKQTDELIDALTNLAGMFMP